jgi:hypothetical protein
MGTSTQLAKHIPPNSRYPTMKKLRCLPLLCIIAGVLSAQPPRSNQHVEMEKLGWLIGKWKGSGWIQIGQQGTKEFTQTETVEGRLDGLVVVIEGRGVSKENGTLIHNALAFVSYDDRTRTFRWRAFTNDGRQTDTVAQVRTNSLEWGLEIPQRGRVRYTLTLKENGEWFEVGEMTQDGQSWQKFFEMTLRRDK